MSIVKEFKEFAMRGNVVDLAVGVVIGGAFGKIVSSLVENIVSPIIGIVIGGVKLDGYKWVLKHGPDGEPSVVLNYGSFVQSVVDFVIIAFVIFMVIKLMNTLKRRQESPAAPAAAPMVPPDVQLLTEIRDLLKENK